jgi:transmembrane sensor
MKALGQRLRPVREARTPHEQATQWRLREEESPLSGQELEALESWLAADPRHRSAYEDARLVFDATARHAAHPEVLAFREAALVTRAGRDGRLVHLRIAAGLIAGVLALGTTATTITAMNAPAASRLAAEAARFAPLLPTDAALYRTAVGERSTIVLPDGSTATLNTDSVLKVAYSGDERGVRLLRGQALFDVARNKARPFQVYAADRRITAVGTVFDVRLQGEAVKVALVEGVVNVTPLESRARTSRAAVTMKAGEVLAAAPRTPVRVRTADIRRETSWREGVVVFDDVPLAEAVIEINRYTSRPLQLEDSDIGAFRVSGVFKTGDPDHFAMAMAEVFPLAVDRAWNGSPELRRAHLPRK